MDLESLGWDKDFEEKFSEYEKEGYLQARVAESNRLVYTLLGKEGEIYGKLSGKFKFNCQSKGDYPTVGDWIAYQPSNHKGFVSIKGMLDRKSSFSRKVAGKVTDEQVIAANVDTIFIVSGLDQDFNIRRLERYVVLAADSNAQYVFILNKADLCENIGDITNQLETLFPEIPIHTVSALENQGLTQLDKYFQTGKTSVFLGSSGVGKSTIINRLVGEEKQKTGTVRSQDGRGRHVTTTKSIIFLPSGGLVIDTPGLRELQMLSSGQGISNAFSDIEELSQNCKYKNCTHQHEPDCAVKTAVDEGFISEKRVENFVKISREIDHNISKSNPRLKNKKNKFWMMVEKNKKQMRKNKNKNF